LFLSFGAAREATNSTIVKSTVENPHRDQSKNHTLTIKYKTKSFLQMIGRIPVSQELGGVEAVGVKKEREEDAPEFIEVNGVSYKKKKAEKEVKIEEEPLKFVDGVIVID
jgi:hypothetical protein